MKFNATLQLPFRKMILAVAAAVMCLPAVVPTAAAQLSVARFDLFPNPKFVSCLGVTGGPTPQAQVTVSG